MIICRHERRVASRPGKIRQIARSKGASDVIAEALRQHQVSRPGFDIVMTPELEKLLDEGMEYLEQASTTEELRQRR